LNRPPFAWLSRKRDAIPALARPLLGWAQHREKIVMSRWIHLYSYSIVGIRSMLPVIAALLAIRPENTNIATSIPGLGDCKSTYCKPERRTADWPR